MANGGGPACLRLRVVADPAFVDQRFLATAEKLEAIARIVTDHWPAAINPDQLSDPELTEAIKAARGRLLAVCGLTELDR